MAAASIAEGSRTRILLLAAATERAFAACYRCVWCGSRDVMPEVLIHDLRQVAAGRRLSIRTSRAREARTTTYTTLTALAASDRYNAVRQPPLEVLLHTQAPYAS